MLNKAKLDKANKIHGLIVDKYEIQSDNHPGSHFDEHSDQIYLKNSLIVHFDKNFFGSEQASVFFKGLKYNSKQLELAEYLLIYVFSKTFKVGNCGYQAIVAAVEYLKANEGETLQMLNLYGERKDENHQILVINSDKSSIDNPLTLKNTIVFNSWNGSKPSFYLDRSPNISELSGGSLSSLVRHKHVITLEAKLDLQDFDFIIAFYKKLNETINEELLTATFKSMIKKINWRLDVALKEVDISELTQSITHGIEAEIAEFKKCKQETMKKMFTITHYDKTVSSPFLFSNEQKQLKKLQKPNPNHTSDVDGKKAKRRNPCKTCSIS